MAEIAELHVRRDNLASVTPASRTVEPGPGEALFAVERFALTANNMTYAAHGMDMAYWQFFPAPDGFGIVPVWGFGRAIASRAEGVAEGDRLYGYWPMASHAVLTPARVTARGLVDAASHRQKLPPVYNGYVRPDDALGDERVQALFRPLYTTSFVLDLALAGAADVLVLTSASSKTALGLAQLARGRQRIIGLTSPANIGFTRSTGCYDDVLPYADAASLAVTGTAALVDFSGNGSVRHAVYAALGAQLVRSLIVGDTHYDTANRNDLPGVAAELFFAPSVIADRIAAWGQDGFDARLGAAWRGFTQSVAWLKLVEADGAAAACERWRGLAAGRVDPAEGLTVRL
jgi:hypothetical protein